MKQKIWVLLLVLLACAAAAANPQDLAVEQALRARFELTEFRCYELFHGSACDFRLAASSRAVVAKAFEEILETLPDDYEFQLRGHVTAKGLFKSSGRVVAARDRAGLVTSQVPPNSLARSGGPSPASPGGRTYGTECTTYRYGNTSGVSCRTWGP